MKRETTIRSDHSRKAGHFKETCWKLHGKPADWKPNRTTNDRESRGNIAATEGQKNMGPTPFAKDQLEVLQQLFNKAHQRSGSKVIDTGNVVQQGDNPLALHVSHTLPSSWIVDSGASNHMTGNRTLFSSYYPYHGTLTVHIADGTCPKVAGIGTVNLSQTLALESVLFVPNLDCNLVFVSKFNRDLNCGTKFLAESCVFQDLKSRKMIGNGELCAGLYLLKVNNSPTTSECGNLAVKSHCQFSSFESIDHSNKVSTIMMWHYHLGHPNFSYLECLFPSLFINKNAKLFQCDVCQLSKHTRSLYTPRPHTPPQPFSLIHGDIWGPSRFENITGTRWFLLLVDDHTRLSWTFLMKNKSETSQIFQIFHKMIQNQFQTNIQVFKTDNARDFFNSILGSYLQSHGIVHQSSCVDTPQQNGVAEHKKSPLA